VHLLNKNNFIQRNLCDKSKANGIFRQNSSNQRADRNQTKSRAITTGNSDSVARTDRDCDECKSFESKSLGRPRTPLPRVIGCGGIDVRYNCAGSDDSVSQRRWPDEKVYGDCFKDNCKSRQQVFKDKIQSKRDFGESEVSGSSITLSKDEGAEARSRQKLYHTTMELHEFLQNSLAQSTNVKNKSVIELQRISDLMKTLFPQILHSIKTGFVAPKKIIHLQMSELYSIVRLVRANGFFVKESITSGWVIVVDFFSRVQILRNFPETGGGVALILFETHLVTI
jgi:hypothetical protein